MMRRTFLGLFAVLGCSTPVIIKSEVAPAPEPLVAPVPDIEPEPPLAKPKPYQVIAVGKNGTLTELTVNSFSQDGDMISWQASGHFTRGDKVIGVNVYIEGRMKYVGFAGETVLYPGHSFSCHGLVPLSQFDHEEVTVTPNKLYITRPTDGIPMGYIHNGYDIGIKRRKRR